MGLFEDSIEVGMRNAEFRRGWFEAEAELAAYYETRVPEIVAAPENIVVFSYNVAVGMQKVKSTLQSENMYRTFVFSMPGAELARA